MTAALLHIGRFCARRRRLVIALWIVAAVGLTTAAQIAGERTTDELTLPGTDSTRAAELLETALPDQAHGTNPIVVRTSAGSLTDADHEAALRATVESLRQTPHVVSVAEPALSGGRTIASIAVTLDEGPADLTEEEAQAILDAAEPARAAGLSVDAGGYVGAALSKPSTRVSEAIGLGAAVLILLLALGSVAAMSLPIVTAVLALAATLGAITLLGHVVAVPSTGHTLATMIGLGVGIDYALFVVSRHRALLRGGVAVDEAIARATAGAGGAVLFAGGTVVIALVALAVAGIPLVTALGCVAAVAVVVSVLAAVTLLPALLAVVGSRLEPAGEAAASRWTDWGRAVAARPWRALAAGVAVLAVLAVPALHLHLGQSDVGALPDSTTARGAYEGMTDGFGPGSNGPLLVGVELPDGDAGLGRLADAIAATPGVASVGAPTVDPDGTAAVLSVVPESAPADRATERLVDTLRDDVIPATGLPAYVGGQTAAGIDLADRIATELPAMIAIVVALSVVVLVLAFRSLLVPLKAAVMNLLSVAAAYGVVTFVFQDGHGALAVGLDGPVPIVSFVPLLMFAILFGLSMDYEVFLLTEMRERFQRDQCAIRAVIDGLASTGRVITSAALIMVVVFASFVLNGDPVVKQFGVGLAVAIAIDATVVRCLLVPAVMTLLGRASWWMPRWMDRWLPRLSLEGEA